MLFNVRLSFQPEVQDLWYGSLKQIGSDVRMFDETGRDGRSIAAELLQSSTALTQGILTPVPLKSEGIEGIVIKAGMSASPDYYRGRGINSSDVDQRHLGSIHEGIKTKFGIEAANSFVELVAELGRCSAVTFLTELYRLAAAEWKLPEVTLERGLARVVRSDYDWSLAGSGQRTSIQFGRGDGFDSFLRSHNKSEFFHSEGFDSALGLRVRSLGAGRYIVDPFTGRAAHEGLYSELELQLGKDGEFKFMGLRDGKKEEIHFQDSSFPDKVRENELFLRRHLVGFPSTIHSSTYDPDFGFKVVSLGASSWIVDTSIDRVAHVEPFGSYKIEGGRLVFDRPVKIIDPGFSATLPPIKQISEV